MSGRKIIMKSKKTFLILLSVGLVLATVGVFFRPARGQTWVGGSILTDTTWTITDSPYVVIETVTVYPNATLTIESGVEVRFADGFSLVVNGNLSAVGTSDQPIVFTSNRIAPNPPFPGAWNGLLFSGNEDTSFILIHSKVSFATNGIHLTNTGGATIKFCEVSNCSLHGLYVKQQDVTSQTANVQYNKFFHNLGSGIYVNPAYPGKIHNFIVCGNMIFRNSYYGMYLYPWGGISDSTIAENSLYDNGRSGLYIYYGSGANFTISENLIYRNSRSADYGGLQCSGGSPNIVGNHIIDNYHDGVYSENAYINDNVISANSRYGIHAGSNNIIVNNSISYNTQGIYTRYSNEVHYNDIYSNYEYGLYRYGGTINATYNYWGDPTGPYHESLNPTGLGNGVNGDGINLQFIPFLSSPVRSINERPIAHLEASPAQPMFNQTVTFNASLSDDDGRVDYYYFDFGDGTNTDWTTLSVVFHEYSQEGVYNATLIVKDDFGVTSLDGDLVYIEITVVPEFPSFIILPLFMIATLLAVMVYRRKHSM